MNAVVEASNLIGDDILQIELTCKYDSHPTVKGDYTHGDRYHDLYELCLWAYEKHPEWFDNNDMLKRYAQAAYLGWLHERGCDSYQYEWWHTNNPIPHSPANVLAGQDPFYVMVKAGLHEHADSPSGFRFFIWNTLMCIDQGVPVM